MTKRRREQLVCVLLGLALFAAGLLIGTWIGAAGSLIATVGVLITALGAAMFAADLIQRRT